MDFIDGRYVDPHEDRSQFADPFGRSALRKGPRKYPSPTCKEPNRLTRRDVQLRYQCDACADRDEGRLP